MTTNQTPRRNDDEPAQTVSLSRKDMDDLIGSIAEANAKSLAVAVDGLAEKLTSEDSALRFWSAGYRALRHNATEHTRRWGVCDPMAR